MDSELRIAEGYWRIDDDKGSRVCCITKDYRGLRIDYVLYLEKEDQMITGSISVTEKDPTWVVIPEPITEKEYFVAQLRGKP